MFKIKRHNKIQFIFTIDKMIQYGNTGIGWNKFIIGIIKIKSIPDDGGMIMPENYKGFLFSFNYWLPFCDIRFK